MELRHLRYFVAVAEEGSLTLAAEKRLHTAQPSLSRQIRDLEYEVGVALLTRSVHGVELTAAGRAFLDHPPPPLPQPHAAREAEWLPRATNILRDELLNIEIRVSSDHSTMLADELLRGKLDIAFLRAEPVPDLEFKPVAKEPLVAILPSDHRLAKQKAVDPQDFVGETYIGISNTPRVLRAIIGDYFKRRGLEIVPTLEIDNYAMAISLVASRRGVALLPISAENFLPWPCVSPPLKHRRPPTDPTLDSHHSHTPTTFNTRPS